MPEYVDQTPENDIDAEQTGSVLDMQRLDEDRPEVEAHFSSPLCLEV
ncbi:hypothetical protein ACN27G_07990 [Plantactinospora sp. WMMB334]